MPGAKRKTAGKGFLKALAKAREEDRKRKILTTKVRSLSAGDSWAEYQGPLNRP